MNTQPTTESSKLLFDAMFNLAVDCHEKGKLQDALEMFQALSLVDPQDAGVWQALARCHDDLGQADVAAMVRSIGAQIEEIKESAS